MTNVYLQESMEKKSVANQKRTVLILGSTGSVGSNAVDLILKNPEDFQVKTLVAFRNIGKLAEQAIALNAEHVVIIDETLYQDLVCLLSGHKKISVYAGKESMLDLARLDYDTVIAAITGIESLEPILASIPNSSTLIIASKESLVCAGHIILEMARIHNTRLIPIDSEHNAIFQLWESHNVQNISTITLTASGGPFWKYNMEEINTATIEQALAHPIWKMGNKISIDSATMINKGFEVITAHHLFGLPLDKIEVVVHPEGVVHGMISYVDGVTTTCFAQHHMQIPINYALYYPSRRYSGFRPLDLTSLGGLSFYPPDHTKFPLLKIATNAVQHSLAAIIAVNAANEVAVEAFLSGLLAFGDIQKTIIHATEKFSNSIIDTIHDIIEWDKIVRQYIFKKIR